MPERYLGRTFGKYQVESLVGSGGFAWVFKGFDPELEIPVAIKVLKPQYSGDETLVDRFRREASTAAKLRHPNIIKIFTVGKEGDAVYFVMDYLPTGLADKLEATPSLPEDYVLRVGIDVARALGFAHREGVIHRDIKVDNILFDAHGNAVVADFGIARAVSGYTQHTGTNMVVGTPQYFAPEQARAKPLDGRADIYSLGVTLFRASTGRLPFEGDDWYEIARQHVEDPPPSPRSVAPALTPEFESMILRCLAKSPDDRPATGDELAEHLDAIRQQHRDPSVARTVTVPAQLTNTLATPALAPRRVAAPPPRQTALRATVLVPILLGLSAVAGAAWWVTSRLAQATPTPTASGDSSAIQTIPPFSDTTGATGVDPTRLDSGKPPKTWLRVTVPADAQLTVNGKIVSTVKGQWTSDPADTGIQRLHAVVPSVTGCPTATDTATVNIRPTMQRSVGLAPRPCGTLALTAQGRDSRDRVVPGTIDFVLESAGKVFRQGQLPLNAPLVLPVGTYRLTLTQRQSACAPYVEQALNVQANQRVDVSVPLYCR